MRLDQIIVRGPRRLAATGGVLGAEYVVRG